LLNKAGKDISNQQKETILVKWLGVAGVELQHKSRTLVIDPFFSRPNLWDILWKPLVPNYKLVSEKLPYCDHILVSHAHWDHLMDVPEIARLTGAMVYGSPNTCKILGIHGTPENQVHRILPGDRFQIGDFSVQALSAEHLSIPGFTPRALSPDLEPPLRASDYQMDFSYSYSIQVGGIRLLDWCSVRIENALKADILFVNLVEDEDFFKGLIDIVKPEIIIPLHWDNFLRPFNKPLQPFFKPPRWSLPPIRRMKPQRFMESVRRINPRITVLLPEIFSLYDLTLLLGNQSSRYQPT
jgi:L-ascorbate metabolism protein UlaG (beta-lactamase superfamily)